MLNTTAVHDVIVVGAGAIGTAIAWRCAGRGLSVTVVDPGPGRGAWHTAAGMLAPVTELHYTEAALLQLNLESLASYRPFIDEIEDLTGLSTGFRECGTVAVAWDGGDLAALNDVHAFAERLGIQTTVVSGRELRRLEPSLTPSLPGGLVAGGDHQVDPRLLHAALSAAAAKSGVTFLRGQARVDVRDGQCVGIALDNGQAVRADVTVIAAGAWSGHVEGVESEFLPPVRPVKGTTLRLRLPGEPRLGHVIRATVKGSSVYLVPRDDGQLVVGASVEDVGFDTSTRAGAIYELLRDAQSIFPELGEAVVDDISVGLRPGTPDNAPILGPSGLKGLHLATGHYRNGILLTPVTAVAITELIATGICPANIAPFAPARFDKAVNV